MKNYNCRYICLKNLWTKPANKLLPALNNCCTIIYKHEIERGIEIKGKLLNHKVEPVLTAIKFFRNELK